jgi:hypothetical protein
MAVTLLLIVPAAAQARSVYINAQLSEAYLASRPTGEHWQSTASVSAYYRTSSYALASGGGTLHLTPTATLGRFAAMLTEPLPAAAIDCSWHGSPGGGQPLAQLQDGTPFADALSIQWPDDPAMWDQSLSSGSSAQCARAFSHSPLQGDVQWVLAGATGAGGGNHFLFAAVPRAHAVEDHHASVSVTEMAMTSRLLFADGESDSVTAQGFLIESTVPYAEHRDVVPAPAITAGGALPAPLRAGALRRLGLAVVPATVPKGCIAGQKRRRGQRCP